MPKEKTKKRVAIKDLPNSGKDLTASELKNVKGGGVGPCYEPRPSAVGPCDRPRLAGIGPCWKPRN